jgi:hypothetical protein
MDAIKRCLALVIQLSGQRNLSNQFLTTKLCLENAMPINVECNLSGDLCETCRDCGTRSIAPRGYAYFAQNHSQRSNGIRSPLRQGGVPRPALNGSNPSRMKQSEEHLRRRWIDHDIQIRDIG